MGEVAGLLELLVLEEAEGEAGGAGAECVVGEAEGEEEASCCSEEGMGGEGSVVSEETERGRES